MTISNCKDVFTRSRAVSAGRCSVVCAENLGSSGGVCLYSQAPPYCLS